MPRGREVLVVEAVVVGVDGREVCCWVRAVSLVWHWEGRRMGTGCYFVSC